MHEQPKKTWRSWFQFSLSTWLVLVAILGWAMAQRPLFTTQEQLIRDDAFDIGDLLIRDSVRLETALRVFDKLFWPAFAFAAFIGWKAFWLVAERRRNRLPTIV